MPTDSRVIIEKRAGEKLLCGFDFGSWLSEDESISAITSVVSSPTGLTIEDETVSGSRITFFVSSGDAGTRYAVTATITTSLGQILIAEGPLKVN